MKTKSLIIFILMMFAMTSALFAGGFALSGIGSKAIGMGGAFRGMADDPTAMYWNPAGLGFMDHSSITIAGAGIMPTSEFKNTAPLPGFVYNENYKAEKKTWFFPNAYAVYASESPVKFGLGLYVPYGLGAKWNAFNLPDSMMTTTGMKHLNWSDGFPEFAMESSIGVVDIHPTISLRVHDKLSVGAGISVNYGMITIGKLIPHSAYSYYLPTTMYLDGTGIGIGANAGMLWKPNPILNVGLSGKLPSEITLKGEATVRTWLSDVINFGLPGHGTPAYYVPAVVGDTTDAEAVLKLPGDFGVGLSLKPNPNWTINVDFAYTWWSALSSVKVELDSINILGSPLEEKELNMKWKDTFRYSMGTQYQFGMMALRLGFFYDQSPIPDESLSPTWPDVNDKLSGNIGVGMKFGKFGLDLNYEMITFAEREIKTQTLDNMVGKYNTSVSAFNMGLTYHF